MALDVGLVELVELILEPVALDVVVLGLLAPVQLVIELIVHRGLLPLRFFVVAFNRLDAFGAFNLPLSL